MTFLDHVNSRLEQQRTAGLYRHPRVISGPQGPVTVVDGRPAICLCSNNYLGLANHPAITAAAAQALQEIGFGATGARHITGTMDLHIRAETRIAEFLGVQEALLFPTGFMANLAAVQGLAGPDTIVFSDALNHASLIDGARLSKAEVHIYRHCDADHLEQLIRRELRPGRTGLVVTESLFSMDADLAPLQAIRALCDKHRCGLLVDEAHAAGVIGPNGRGLCAALEVRADLITIMLGKAFGTAGAFVAGPAPVVNLIENQARSFIFSTAPSPSLAAAAIAAIDLVEGAEDRRETLRRHAQLLRAALPKLGFQVLGESHILPVVIGGPDETMRISSRLLELGVFVHGIRPPTVPAGTSRLRITPIATHEPQHLQQALQAFEHARPSAPA